MNFARIMKNSQKKPDKIEFNTNMVCLKCNYQTMYYYKSYFSSHNTSYVVD